jgi:hypothetical protein
LNFFSMFCRYSTLLHLKDSTVSEDAGIEPRGGIFLILRSPGINSKESIPPAYVGFVLEFLDSL